MHHGFSFPLLLWNHNPALVPAQPVFPTWGNQIKASGSCLHMLCVHYKDMLQSLPLGMVTTKTVLMTGELHTVSAETSEFKSDIVYVMFKPWYLILAVCQKNMWEIPQNSGAFLFGE